MKNNSESSQLVTSHNWSQASHSFEAFLGYFSKHLCTFRKKEATKVEGQFVGLIFHGELSIIKLMTLSLNTNLKKLFYSIRKFTSSSSSFSFGSCRVSALLWFRDGWFSLSCLDSKAMTTVKKGHQDCWERRKRPTVFKDKRCEASTNSIKRSFAPRKAVGRPERCWPRSFPFSDSLLFFPNETRKLLKPLSLFLFLSFSLFHTCIHTHFLSKQTL